MKNYDLIVIGSGAGNIVIDAAAKKGLNCALIEKGKFGGTCLTRGCIPTKVMVTAADEIQHIKKLPKIGVEVGKAHINWDVMSKRVWQKIDESIGVKEYYENMPNVDVYHGAAEFLNDKELVVNYKNSQQSDILTATNIVIATGAHTLKLNLPGLEEAGYLTSESLFGEKYPSKPFNSLIVLGGGAIATEFAHVFNSAGTDVTIIQRNEFLLKKEEPEISLQLAKSFTKQGINVQTGTKLLDVHLKNGLKVIRYEKVATGEILEVEAEEILLATGIQPATEELHLERTNLKLNKGGWIITNEFLETSVEGIYALGDINGESPLRHKANYEADILSHNLYVANSPADFRWARYDLVPAVTYTYPQIGHVGLTAKEAEQLGHKVKTAINYYANTAKGFAMGYDEENKNDAFVKIVVDEDTNYILGIHVIGPEASILFQPFVNLLNVGETTIKAINPEIGSALTQKLRTEGLTRYLDPKSVISVGETMTPHPALSEVIMWTQVYYENRW